MHGSSPKKVFFITNNFLCICFVFSRTSTRIKLWPEMRFNTALVSLWLVCLLDVQLVSGGPGFGALCTFACNVGYAVCVGGITYASGSAGFLSALELCGAAQELCSLACLAGTFAPTPWLSVLKWLWYACRIGRWCNFVFCSLVVAWPKG